ncbi:hypothetical protein E4U43_002673 [Claviceps pusilla]|uniref:CBF1-interacting co-repressor CIR N-terminal domain-containing protein n=1 Tax=Claviceps pusilla TaxID=123648 RepID=A0A9P7SY77_9HYPO|nr:hypothetical protein E4U43_002673 [Claviceps pusilla]
MPLHLLGKKSWNVYNADNIARVRRDEAAAKAAEEAEEQRMQEFDAQRRLAILRGEKPLPPSSTEEQNEAALERARPGPESGRPRRKRKREDEDDTDFEMRLARERAEPGTSALEVSHKPSSSSAPIVDHRGHFDLFGDEKSRAHAEKNEDAEREAQKKKREHEDQFTMRLANAAGKDGVKEPWYLRGNADGQTQSLKDIWGKDHWRRKQRDADDIAANDPLAMMRKGASRVRELQQQRKKIQEQRDKTLRQSRTEDRREDRREERHRGKHGGESRHRSASPDSSRRRRRSRERRDAGEERNRYRDRDRDRERRRRRHEHSHQSDSLGSRSREERRPHHRENS